MQVTVCRHARIPCMTSRIDAMFSARQTDLNDLATSSECGRQQIGDAIINRRIMKGMTEPYVYTAWEPACGICAGTRNSSSWGDVWEHNASGYGDVRRATFVYFTAGGRVSGWSNDALP